MLAEENDILNTLFQVRDEELAMITKQDKENLREVNQRLKQEELKVKETINYLPKVMKQNKRNIIDSESIANKYGNYGSEYSQISIFNKYGNYGSPYSNESPFNQYTQTPPVIKDKNNELIGVLTANQYLRNRIDAVEFFKWFNLKLEKH